jgi:hypothetical protein
MIYANLLQLEIKLDSGEELANTEFKELNITEAVYSLPVITLTLVFMGKARFAALKDTKKLNITITYGTSVPPKVFVVDVLSVKSPMVGITKVVMLKGILFIPEFCQDRQKRSFLNKTPTEVVKSLTSIKVDKVGDFSIPDSFFQLNTNDWDFISNHVLPYAQSDKGGYPLYGVTILPELRVYDSKDEKAYDYRISPNGVGGTYEYSELLTDTEFDEDYFMNKRQHSILLCNYKEAKYLPLSEDEPIIDFQPVLDNGNGDENRAITPYKNERAYLMVDNVKVGFKNNTFTPFELLDRIDLLTSENEIEGQYWVSKVLTVISTGVNRTIHLKGI